MERQEALVQAAYRLLAERGFEGLRTRDVAARVGVNVATLHYYFPTKEALIQGVVGHAMGRSRSTLSVDGSPAARVRGHFAGRRRLARDEPELFAVMGEFALRARRDPAIAAIVQRTDDVWHATLRGLLRRAQRDGALSTAADADEAAGVVVAALKGVFLLAPAEKSRRLARTLAQLERWLGLKDGAARKPL